VTDETDIHQGTLALIVLKPLEALGAIHGCGIARRIEQISGDMLSINYGTLPCTAQAGTGGLRLVRLGSLRQQPQG
jgi:hypothetical protein